MAEKDRLGKKEIEEYHASQGAVVPGVEEPTTDTAAETTESEAAPAEKNEEPTKKAEKADPKDQKKDAPAKAKDGDDPHAENHRKALQEARAEMRELRRRAEEDAKARDARHTELQKKFDEFVKAVQAPPPSREAQPFEYLENENKKLREEVQQLSQWREESQRTERGRSDIQQLNDHIVRASTPFAQQTPDYQEAYAYVVEMKEEEMRFAGIPEEHIGTQRLQWEQAFAVQALRAQKSPSQQLYAFAQRLGYKKKDAKPGAKGNGADEKLATIQRGQEASKTLTGGGAETELSLATLEQMSDEQIRQLAKDPKKWLKVAGQLH